MKQRIACSTLTGLALLICALPAGAQTITGYQLRVYLTGGGAAPVTTYDMGLAGVTCGQPKTPAPVTAANPNTVLWDDPTNAALDCRWVDPGTGPLLALPVSVTASYTAAVVALSTAGPSPESARSNSFTRPGLPPAALVNVRVTR